MWISFFEWLLSPDTEIDKFEKEHNDSVRALIELMGEPWASIQLMPFTFFTSTLKWKLELEEKKKAAIEERNREQEAEYKRRLNAQKAAERRARRR